MSELSTWIGRQLIFVSFHLRDPLDAERKSTVGYPRVRGGRGLYIFPDERVGIEQYLGPRADTIENDFRRRAFQAPDPPEQTLVLLTSEMTYIFDEFVGKRWPGLKLRKVPFRQFQRALQPRLSQDQIRGLLGTYLSSPVGADAFSQAKLVCYLIKEIAMLEELENRHWKHPDVWELFFYGALFRTAYPTRKTDATEYLAEHMAGGFAMPVEAQLSVFTPDYFEPDAHELPTGLLHTSKGVLKKVEDLIQRDLGNSAEYYVKQAQSAFHASPSRRLGFKGDAMSIFEDTLQQAGLVYFDELDNPDTSRHVVLLSNDRAKSKQKWFVSVCFSTGFENSLEEVALAYSHLNHESTFRYIKKGIKGTCLFISPTFSGQAIRYAIGLQGGVRFLDAATVWLLQSQLDANSGLAAKIVARIPEFLGDRYGLLDVWNAIKRVQ